MTDLYERITVIDIAHVFRQRWHWFVNHSERNLAATQSLQEVHEIAKHCDHIVVAIDEPPYDRKTRYPEYKGNREPASQGMLHQQRWLMRELAAQGYHIAGCPGYEADDIVATLVGPFRLVCSDVRIVGRDKDLFQLVNGKVRLLLPAKGNTPAKLVDEREVVNITGVSPKQIVDWLSLQGDKDDNVPGCPKVGKVTATKLIHRFSTLDNLYRELEAEPVKFQELVGKAATWNLREHKDQVMRARDLIRLNATAPIDLNKLLEKRKVPEVTVRDYESDPWNDEAPPESGEMKAKDMSDNDDEFDMGPDPFGANDNAGTLEKERELGLPEVPISPPKAGKSLEQLADEMADEANEKREREKQQREPTQPSNPKPEPEPKPEPPKQQVQYVQARPVDAGAALALQQTRDLVRSMPYELSLQPTSVAQAYKIAVGLHKSGMYRKFENPEAILAVIMRGRELGIGMMTALDLFHIVEGKPAPAAALIMSLAESDPNCVWMTPVSWDDTHATYAAEHRIIGKLKPYTYTIEQAEKAGLLKPSKRTGEPSMWIKRPEEMLLKTAGSKGARVWFPKKCAGLYCPEEMVVDAIAA